MPVCGPSVAEMGPLEIDGEIEIGIIMWAGMFKKCSICKMHEEVCALKPCGRMEALRALDR